MDTKSTNYANCTPNFDNAQTAQDIPKINHPFFQNGRVKIPKYMLIANAELGQQEVAGAEDNPRIVEYHSVTTYKATNDETPWCSSFVNWVMFKAEIARTKSASALQWREWGIKVPPRNVKYGDVIIWDHGHGRGHVAFYIGRDTSGDVIALGGNQGNSVTIGRFDGRVPFEVRRPKGVMDSTTVWNGGIGLGALGLTAHNLTNTPTALDTVASQITDAANNLAQNADVLVDPSMVSSLSGVIPDDLAVYIPIIIAGINLIYMVYKRVWRLKQTNI